MIRTWWGIHLPRSVQVLCMVFGVLLISAFFNSSLFLRTPVSDAQSVVTEFYGYAWSDNIGWISMNCDQTATGGGNTCGSSNYKVQVLEGNPKTLSGYAWSDNVGWVRFGGLSGFPGGGGNAAINDDDEMTGWARALSYGGGWDGWISLNCSNTGGCGTSNYKVTLGTGSFPNTYAWGSDIVGWVDFDQVGFEPPCPSLGLQCTEDGGGYALLNQWCELGEPISCQAGTGCSPETVTCVGPSGDLAVTPRRVREGSTVTASWSAEDALECTVTVQGTSDGPWSCVTNCSEVSSPITSQTVFTLSCTPLDGGTPVVIDSETVEVIPTLYET